MEKWRTECRWGRLRRHICNRCRTGTTLQHPVYKNPSLSLSTWNKFFLFYIIAKNKHIIPAESIIILSYLLMLSIICCFSVNACTDIKVMQRSKIRRRWVKIFRKKFKKKVLHASKIISHIFYLHFKFCYVTLNSLALWRTPKCNVCMLWDMFSGIQNILFPVQAADNQQPLRLQQRPHAKEWACNSLS